MLANRIFARLAGAVVALTVANTQLNAEPVTLQIVGTGDGIDVLRALVSAFMEKDTSVRLEVPPSIHSNGGIAAVGAGKAILGRVARQLSDSEIAMGIAYKPIFRLPSAFFVDSKAGVASITAEQLVEIYSGKMTNWKQMGGADRRIRVVRREDVDSTLTVLRASMPGWRDLVITEKSKTATTTQEAVETVREVSGAIGFGPFSKTLEQGITVLKIDGRYPTDAAYPSNVILALIYTDAALIPEARSFLKFVGTAKAREVIASLGGVPMSP